MYTESSVRSILKSISWRLTGTFTTALLVFAFTGKLTLALSVASVELVAKMGIYYAHERAWNSIHFGRHSIQPAVIWLTGLPGSGKSTLADRIEQELCARRYKVERLDGDSIRHIFPGTGFSRSERDSHIQRVGYLASKLEANGVFVVASFVSPYRNARQFVRELCRNFVEIHVSTPLATCEGRDAKGLYARARRGELKNFTGIDDPYEPPESADIEIDTTHTSVDDAAARVMGFLDRLARRS